LSAIRLTPTTLWTIETEMVPSEQRPGYHDHVDVAADEIRKI
jgi:hypothetical protein